MWRAPALVSGFAVAQPDLRAAARLRAAGRLGTRRRAASSGAPLSTLGFRGRRALEAAGFEVTRVPGYGRKRHMTRARLP